MASEAVTLTNHHAYKRGYIAGLNDGAGNGSDSLEYLKGFSAGELDLFDFMENGTVPEGFVQVPCDFGLRFEPATDAAKRDYGRALLLMQRDNILRELANVDAQISAFDRDEAQIRDSGSHATRRDGNRLGPEAGRA